MGENGPVGERLETRRILLLISALAVCLGATLGFLLTRWGPLAHNRHGNAFSVAPVSVGIMLPVADVQRAEVFYRDKLGFRVVRTGSETILFQAGLTLYLVNPGPPALHLSDIMLAPPEDRRRLSGGLVIQVKNCHRAYDELTRRGVEFLAQPQRSPSGGWHCFTRDPDGNLIEIEEENSGSDVDLTPLL